MTDLLRLLPIYYQTVNRYRHLSKENVVIISTVSNNQINSIAFYLFLLLSRVNIENETHKANFKKDLLLCVLVFFIYLI